MLCSDIIYYLLPSDNTVVDRRDGRQLGMLQKSGEVEWFGDEERAIHEKNLEVRA